MVRVTLKVFVGFVPVVDPRSKGSLSAIGDEATRRSGSLIAFARVAKIVGRALDSRTGKSSSSRNLTRTNPDEVYFKEFPNRFIKIRFQMPASVLNTQSHSGEISHM